MSVLNDGFSTTITLTSPAATMGITALEKTVTPTGWEGGGPIPITTMRNTLFRTQVPKQLQQLGTMTLTVAWDPVQLDSLAATIAAAINVNQLITITFPDGSTFAFYGWIDEFKPQEHREGEQPLATMTVIPSMVDTSGAEFTPVYTAA